MQCTECRRVLNKGDVAPARGPSRGRERTAGDCCCAGGGIASGPSDSRFGRQGFLGMKYGEPLASRENCVAVVRGRAKVHLRKSKVPKSTERPGRILLGVEILSESTRRLRTHLAPRARTWACSPAEAQQRSWPSERSSQSRQSAARGAELSRWPRKPDPHRGILWIASRGDVSTTSGETHRCQKRRNH